MPPKFRKFTDLIKHSLFYVDDDIAVVEESDVKKAGLSVSDISLAFHYLEKNGIVKKHKTFYAFHLTSVPTEYERRVYMLNNMGLAAMLPEGLIKLQYIIQVDREKFEAFLGPIGSSKKQDRVVKGLSFDADKSILLVGNIKILIRRKNENPIEHYVLQYMFENEEGLGAKVYYSEMGESALFKKYGVDGKDTRSYWRACTHIQEKAEKEGVKNLLMVTTGTSGWAQINSNYLQN